MAQLFDLTINEWIDSKDSFLMLMADEDESVATVIQKLGENKISSVPILGKSGCTGVVDMLDLLTYAGTKMGYSPLDPVSSKRAVKEFLAKTMKDLINVSGRNEFISVKQNAPFYDVIKLLSKPDIHRVAIVNKSNEFVGIITQSDLIRYIKENQQQLGSKMNKKIKDLWKLGEKKVESIHCDKFVIDALVRLETSRVSGIAVVDNHGKIVGNISASDLKRMQVKLAEQLCYDIYQNIHQFINVENTESQAKLSASLPHFDAIIVQGEDTLGQVVDTVTTKRVHRVYVVDDQQKPIGEISLCDILCQFTEGLQSP